VNADCELKVCTIYLAVVGKGWWEGNEGERRVDASRRTDFFPLPIQICDFGLARGFAPGGDEERGGAGFMTECEFFFISFSLSLFPSLSSSSSSWTPSLLDGVVLLIRLFCAFLKHDTISDVATRWYRAPEIMLSFANVSVLFPLLSSSLRRLNTFRPNRADWNIF